MSERTSDAQMIRMDRGDGRLFMVADGPDMAEFMKMNPTAKRATQRVAQDPGVMSPMELAAIDAQRQAVATDDRAPSMAMKKEELIAFAAAHDVDVTGASTKGAILERIAAAGNVTSDEEGDEDEDDGA